MSKPYSLLPFSSMVDRYAAYGVSVHSDAPLPLAPWTAPGLFEIEVRHNNGPVDLSLGEKIGFEQDPANAFDVGSLPDGSHHVGLRGVGKIVISPDGRLLTCHRLAESASESFNVYLLTRALSYALVKQGLEPLHATVAAIEGKAAIFVGDCGLGKSTLAAAFLQAGYPLLTDDLLVLHEPNGTLLAYPGSPRIKLFPEMARWFLGEAVTGVPMNPYTHKLILPLKESQVCTHPLPVGAIYALALPSEVCGPDVSLSAMTRRQAFLTLLANTFNRAILEPARLRRQFEATQALANTVPVKTLSYQRSLDSLPAVLEFVASDLCAERSEVACEV
jgi:hypothetical protein